MIFVIKYAFVMSIFMLPKETEQQGRLPFSHVFLAGNDLV